ncbi:MAG TPA: SUMF1/EgtB/PvdO family nonheme iron enzyme, partial [Treponemataceae bacterium]|nr:SUMF1/EgtB/PvdO family nonheme iron enzyme [Treponemataceae bacterium]
MEQRLICNVSILAAFGFALRAMSSAARDGGSGAPVSADPGKASTRRTRLAAFSLRGGSGMMKKASLLAALTIWILAAGSLFPEPAGSRPRLAAFGFNNLTGDARFDLPAEASTETLALSMRMLGIYDVAFSDMILRNGSIERLADYCARESVDFVLFGDISPSGKDSWKFRLSVFDRASGSVTITKTAACAGVLGVFDATDRLMVSVLTAITGRHVGFGSLAFVNTGDALDFEVDVDGFFLARNPATVDRLLDGTHRVQVYQGTGQVRTEVYAQDVTITEGKTATVSFALEKAKEPAPEVLVRTVYLESGSDIPTMTRVRGGTPAKRWSYGPVADFYMSLTEITQTQYRKVMDKNPSVFNGVNLPVENLSWYEAVEFCNALSRSEGLELAYALEDKDVVWNTKANGYRLPTEAEFVFASLGGAEGGRFK